MKILAVKSDGWCCRSPASAHAIHDKSQLIPMPGNKWDYLAGQVAPTAVAHGLCLFGCHEGLCYSDKTRLQ